VNIIGVLGTELKRGGRPRPVPATPFAPFDQSSSSLEFDDRFELEFDELFELELEELFELEFEELLELEFEELFEFEFDELFELELDELLELELDDPFLPPLHQLSSSATRTNSSGWFDDALAAALCVARPSTWSTGRAWAVPAAPSSRPRAAVVSQVILRMGDRSLSVSEVCQATGRGALSPERRCAARRAGT
jgi:hypothetical protein